MRATLSAESVIMIELLRSSVWICEPWRMRPLMTGCASATPMCLSSTTCVTNEPGRAGAAFVPPSSGRTSVSVERTKSVNGSTRRNFSPSGSSAMPLKLSAVSIALRYSSSVSGLSGVERSVMLTCGTLGSLMIVRPVRSAYSMITRSAEASWKLRALSDSS